MWMYNLIAFVVLLGTMENGILCIPTTIHQHHQPQPVLFSITHQYGPRHRFDNAPQGSDTSADSDMDNDWLGPPPNADIVFNAPIPDSLADSSNDVSNEINLPQGITESEEDAFVQGLIDEIKSEEDIAIKSANLLKLLQENPTGPLPVVYVEEERETSSPYGLDKRSGRYYRRYPWKRQNQRFRNNSSNNNYDADSKYQCVPSREDVFKLLVGLHENRNGNQHKTVNFCNRKRPAKAIFTNIRFLG